MYWVATAFNLAILAGLAFLFFGDMIASLLAGNYLPATALVMDVPALLARVIPPVLILIPTTIVFWLVFLYIDSLMSLFALRKAGLPAAPFSFYKLLCLIALGIVSFFVAFLSLFNKIFLIILIAAVGCAVAALFLFLSGATMSGAVFLLLSLFILLVYCIVLIYNSVRLSQCGVIFLSKEIPIAGAIKESWDLTNHQFWAIFIASLLVGIASAIAVGISSLLLAAIITIPLFFVAALPLEISFGIIGQNIASFVVAPFSVLIGSFCSAAIYKNLLADTGQLAAKKSAKKK